MSAPSPAVAWPGPLCGRSECEARLREETAAVIDGLLSVTPYPLQAVFIAGSLATGEALVISGPGGDLCLSDLDAGLVLRSAADRAPARAAVGSWLGGERAAHARAFFARLDIGVYPPAGLALQPLKPGTFEMAARAFIVRGDPATLSALPRFAPEAIPPIEARRLLANRVAELLRAIAGEPARERAAARAFDAAYAAGKLLLDAGSALLVASGAYAVGLERRLRALSRSEAVREAFGERAPRYLEDAEFWTGVRLGRIDWGRVEERYPSGPGAIVAPGLWESARAAAAGAWRGLDGASGGSAWMSAVPARERARRWREWARGRPVPERLEALARLGRGGPREVTDGAAIRLFCDWPAGEDALPPSAPAERALRRLLPSAARPAATASRAAWARTLGAARWELVRAGDE